MTYITARRLLLAAVTGVLAMTLSSVSLAASSPAQHGHEKASPTPRPARPTATASKSKRNDAQLKAQRKTPVKARVAAKSKALKAAHTAPRKLAKPAAKHSRAVG